MFVYEWPIPYCAMSESPRSRSESGSGSRLIAFPDQSAIVVGIALTSRQHGHTHARSLARSIYHKRLLEFFMKSTQSRRTAANGGKRILLMLIRCVAAMSYRAFANRRGWVIMSLSQGWKNVDF